MRKTKTLVALLLAVVLIFAMVACTTGGNDTTAGTDPTDTDPTGTNPIDTDPVGTDPVNPPVIIDPVGPPTDTEPVETNPAETDPVDTEPVETTPGTIDPPETDPAETDPVKPVECQHKYVQLDVTAATCTESGEIADTCIYCGDLQNKRTVEPLGHDQATEDRDVITPLYHTAEVTYCPRCQEIQSMKGSEAHDFNCTTRVADQTTAAGYTTYGFEILECDCGYKMTVSANHADGHFYERDAITGKYVCRCGDQLVGELTDNGNRNAGPEIFR